jgi:hypothetical protein
VDFGVCIIALGHNLYGTSAFNLTLSLKVHEPGLKVALLCEPKSINHLTEQELSYFDYLIEIPSSEFSEKNYFRVKLLVNKYSPFDKTIYLDADNIFFDKRIGNLFKEVSKTNFLIGYNGEFDYKTKLKTNRSYNYWTENESKCCEYHGITGKLPQTISGFFYFEKCNFTNAMFEEAVKVYDDPKAPCISWGAGRADEYCFNVALGKLDYVQEPFNPLYFDKIHSALAFYEIREKYFGLAMGGHKMSNAMIEIYNKLVDLYCGIEKIEQRRFHVNKANVIIERQKS